MQTPSYANKDFAQLRIPWYSPFSVTQWLRRLVSPRTWVFFLICLVLIFSELHFDWLEHLLGNYLSTTNAYRPQSGAIWEQGSQVDSAREALVEYSSQRQNSRIEAQRSTSLGQVVANIADDKGAMISADHFIELFLKLPPAISHEIISPYRLLAEISTGSWMRTFFERQDGQVTVYLLDEQNQVLDRMILVPELLDYIKRGEVAVSMGLDRMADFKAHIYPADRFFKALSGLSEDVRAGIVPRPEDLLRTPGRIRRVGISEVPQSGMVDLGFEIEGLDGPKVILTQGRYENVQRLQYVLEGRTFFGWPGYTEDDL